jgi:hypothetical protein
LSSILKALQRLQSDRATGARSEPQPALRADLARDLTTGAPTGSPPAEEAPARPARRVAVVAGAAAAVLLVGAFGYWLASAGAPRVVEAARREPAQLAETAGRREAPIPGAERAPDIASRPASEPRGTAGGAPAAAAPVAAPPGASHPGPAQQAGSAAPPAESQAPGEPRALRAAPPAKPSASPEEAPTLPATLLPAERRAEDAPPAVETDPASPAPRPAAEERARIELMDGPTPAALEDALGREEARVPMRPPPESKAARGEAGAEPEFAVVAAPPEISVLRTTWHPSPERRVARVRLADGEASIDLHEGDAVATLVVKAIEPSGVVFLHAGRELRRGVGGEGR